MLRDGSAGGGLLAYGVEQFRTLAENARGRLDGDVRFRAQQQFVSELEDRKRQVVIIEVDVHAWDVVESV